MPMYRKTYHIYCCILNSTIIFISSAMKGVDCGLLESRAVLAHHPFMTDCGRW